MSDILNNDAIKLIDAIENNDLLLFKNLIANGCNINSQGKYGNTPLNYAVISGRIKFVDCLIKANCDANIANHFGNTAIYWLIDYYNIYEDTNIPRDLISLGADIDIQDDKGDTPLHKAAFSGVESAVRFLRDHGCNINIKNKLGETPYDVAFRYYPNWFIDLLL